MRLGRPKLKAIAAWLGILALSVNALLPIHLAFDLADALAGTRLEQASPGHQHAGRHLLATLAGHRDSGTPGAPAGRGHVDCFVCGSLGALAGFAGTGCVALLPTPALLDAPVMLAAAAVELRGASPVAYRSRAPPVG